MTQSNYYLESATGLLKMTAEYSYPAAQIDPQLVQYAATIRFAKLKTYFYFGAGSLAFVAFIVYSLKRHWITYRSQQTL
jgi:hypothetical protein